MLSKADLDKISLLVRSEIRKEIRENNKVLFEVFVTKREFSDRLEDFKAEVFHRIATLQDVVLKLRQDFDMDFTIVTKKNIPVFADILEDHERRIGNLEKIRKIKQQYS